MDYLDGGNNVRFDGEQHLLSTSEVSFGLCSTSMSSNLQTVCGRVQKPASYVIRILCSGEDPSIIIFVTSALQCHDAPIMSL